MARPQQMSAMWILGLMFAALTASAYAQSTNTLDTTTFDEAFNVLYGADNQIERSMDGRAVSLSMTELTGSGFQSKDTYLFGQLSMKLKLVPGDAAGVVVCFYLHTMTENHDEFDFEFLGNKSGEPVILQTNIYANGNGGREERIFLWFDPAEKFHTYTVLWNHNQVVFYVDSVPIRVLRNTPQSQSFYPKVRPMYVFSSIWNGDDWATRGGLDKVNWTNAPFLAHYKDFKMNGCVYNGVDPAPDCVSPFYSTTWWSTHDELNAVELRKLEWVRSNYMIYDYCTDFTRYPMLATNFTECAAP
ncbi:xyloglucan:xyloglucosyl transferase [Marchantia polymorpha subsp. ruderalis]|uniref:Xyloglucan endotransglucosylase/hydrolase n=1 Tax=Marchantia polymorpha TaxID=3197 RepID=A0A2R6W2D3_MARPO|nr:hypothetical protein MARPO_0177s0015 [Marchantia polymorpha]BBN02818.1 hypothetical protein Mp_2g18360 [Marchantia polymorpha subsp. ruderalis]|eukprot:PTQ28004.1 hypothetical protein MARPO_0177s0015 [Marchantia polymorpha]